MIMRAWYFYICTSHRFTPAAIGLWAADAPLATVEA